MIKVVAYKNNPGPGEEKIPQEHNCRLSSSMAGTRYNRSGIHNRPHIDNSARSNSDPMSDESLDRLIQTPATNEFYQHASETHGKRIAGETNPKGLVYGDYVTHPTRQKKSYPTAWEMNMIYPNLYGFT